MSLQERLRIASRCGRSLSGAMLLLLCLRASAERPPVPVLRLQLHDLGFPGYAPALLRAGTFSMTTVHLLDNRHLLFTYSMRSLVPRLPGDDENDSDRIVAAQVVELPSGKIVARTQWRLHDHGRYLWRAGQGVFVLRSSDSLFTFAPLRGLPSGTAFERTELPHRPGVPQAIASSPDGAILTVEVQRPGPGTEDPESGRKAVDTSIEFFRLVAPPDAMAPVEVRPAGVVKAPGLLRLALDGDGYLWAQEGSHSRWTVSFNEYAGKPRTLTAIDSTCAPHLLLVSRAEFLAESCRGDAEAPTLSAYGFDGHENWEEPFGEELQAPTLVDAPAAGRFAMSRLVSNSGGSGLSGPIPDDPLTQEIRVYQTESGNMLLRLECVNPTRTAENFDLSPDGSTLAVLGRDAIEIYKLPTLTSRDRKDLAEVQTMLPPLSHGPVVLSRITQPIASPKHENPVVERTPGAPSITAARDHMTDRGAAGSTGSTAGPEHGSLPLGTARPAVAQAEGPATSSASAVPTSGKTPAQAAAEPVTTPRKPPTLLKPGESPEFNPPRSGPE